MTLDPGLVTPILTAEEAALGCALQSSAARAAEIVHQLTAEDIASPAVRLVRRIVVELCDAGITPDAAAVLSRAITTEAVSGPAQIHSLTRTLWTLVDHRATVLASAGYYVAQALEQAWRRRTVEMADRLRQVAEHADAAELQRLTAAEQAAVDAIYKRRQALLPPEGAVLAA